MEKLLHERLREFSEEASKSIHEAFNVNTGWAFAEKIADEIERYYIPRPRFDDGEPVQFNSVAYVRGNIGEVIKMVFNDGGCEEVIIGFEYDSSASHYIVTDGEFVKRPTQKVYDADGVEIKVGQVLWNITGDKALRILALDTNFDLEPVIQTDDGRFKPDQLTHEKPVFDADNERICKGDTVWHVSGESCAWKVERIDKTGAVFCYSEYDNKTFPFDADKLSHKEPDSIERILDDATIDPRIYYNDHIGHDVGLHDDAFIIEKFAQHLIKRAALIERGA